MNDNRQEISELKESILGVANIDKQNLVDRLIELEGMASMEFFQGIFLINPFQQKDGTAKLNDIAGYGVRQLIKLQAILSKSEFKFCPYCKLDLNEYKIVDPYVAGLKCGNDHRFHIEIITDGYCTDKTIHSNKTDPLEIAGDWLSDENLRKQLQNQLAEILRKYIDIKTSIDSEEEKNLSFTYCPICSSSLQKFEQDDVWVEGLKCSNNHILYSRNGLSYKGAELTPDIAKNAFDFLLKAYLKDEQITQIPDQIVKLFSEINYEK